MLSVTAAHTPRHRLVLLQPRQRRGRLGNRQADARAGGRAILQPALCEGWALPHKLCSGGSQCNEPWQAEWLELRGAGCNAHPPAALPHKGCGAALPVSRSPSFNWRFCTKLEERKACETTSPAWSESARAIGWLAAVAPQFRWFLTRRKAATSSCAGWETAGSAWNDSLACHCSARF